MAGGRDFRTTPLRYGGIRTASQRHLRGSARETDHAATGDRPRGAEGRFRQTAHRDRRSPHTACDTREGTGREGRRFARIVVLGVRRPWPPLWYAPRGALRAIQERWPCHGTPKTRTPAR